jgi:hypothetical protein
MSDDFVIWADQEIARIQNGTLLRMPSDHQSMFKYISLNSDISWSRLRSTLETSSLTGTAASDLNDPFEVAPSTFDDLHPDAIAAALKHNDLADRLEGKDVATNAALFPDRAIYRQKAEEFLSKIYFRRRIIAFCERSDSALLWAHYANSYQGACLHFLAGGFRYRQQYLTFGYVNYSNYRPTYPLSLALSLTKPGNRWSMEKAESDKLMFFTKAEDWSYETEIRIVYDVERRRDVGFKPGSLVSIVVGPNFSHENRARLDAALKETAYANLAVRRARLSRTSFSIEIDD